MAPEVRRFLIGEPVSYTTSVDIFSLGMVMVELTLGHFQWTEENLQVLGEEISFLVRKMLSVSPQERPSAKEIVHLLGRNSKL